MNLSKAEEILRDYNKWRHSDINTLTYSSVELGLAIDIAIKCLEDASGYSIGDIFTGFKLRRQELGVSMQEVCDEIGISKATLSRIENGADALFSTVLTLDNYYLDQGV